MKPTNYADCLTPTQWALIGSFLLFENLWMISAGPSISSL